MTKKKEVFEPKTKNLEEGDCFIILGMKILPDNLMPFNPSLSWNKTGDICAIRIIPMPKNKMLDPNILDFAFFQCKKELLDWLIKHKKLNP